MNGAIPSERPPGVPQHIPVWAWKCLRERNPIKPSPVIDYGILGGSGWFLRDHQTGSEVEKVAAVKACTIFGYLALNIDALNLAIGWNSWRVVAAGPGNPLLTLPWSRCRTSTDVTDTIDIATDWGSLGVVLNIEDEAETTLPPAIVDARTTNWRHSLGILVDYRGYEQDGKYHGPNWTCLADRAVGIMEAFDSTATQAIPVTAALRRLTLMGFKRCIVCPSTKLQPAAYAILDGVARVPYVLDIVSAVDVKGWA